MKISSRVCRTNAQSWVITLDKHAYNVLDADTRRKGLVGKDVFSHGVAYTVSATVAYGDDDGKVGPLQTQPTPACSPRCAACALSINTRVLGGTGAILCLVGFHTLCGGGA